MDAVCFEPFFDGQRLMARKRGLVIGWRNAGAKGELATLAVVAFLVLLPLSRPVMLSATRACRLPTVMLPAAKGTAKILPARIARMRQEPDPAVTAAYGAVLQIGTIAQNGIQRQLILTNKRVGAVILVPVLAKRKNFRDGYGKNARFSVRMWIVWTMSPSYYLDA